ncbi:DnaJ domain-containing protein [Arthrobacter sp.]|uniref:DnaJ domain-containing protein n=1 Tax=Arthrobacter sp. TaxID=1667 RepID=UPI0033947DCA
MHVTPDATAAEIQHAFRALMRLRHPDIEAAARASTDAGAGAGNNDGDEARQILESVAVLRDPRSRAEYDPASTSAAAQLSGPGSTTTGGRERAPSQEAQQKEGRHEHMAPLRFAPDAGFPRAFRVAVG